MTYLLLILLLAAGFVYFFTGFKTQKPAAYAQMGPAFDIKKHLGGDLLCEGVLFGPTGAIVERFVATMQGTWDGDTGVLRENFTYSSGTKQDRAWHITLTGNGTFTATAEDIIGTAQGDVSGATLRIKYRLKLTEAAGGHELDVIDWIYLTDNGVMINKSEMRKFGVKVAELVGNIRPAS